MKTNHLSAPVTALDPSLVAIAAWDSRSPVISQKETKRTKVCGVGFAFIIYDPIVVGQPQRFDRVFLANCVPQ